MSVWRRRRGLILPVRSIGVSKDGLKFWYPFWAYETPLQTFPDWSGNGNEGTVVGATTAKNSVYSMVANGSVTQANMRLSGVNGTAFVDFSAASVLTDRPGCFLEIYDSSNRKVIAWIKAAGTGETLGSELSGDTGFDNGGYWTIDLGWSVAASVATAANAGNEYGIYKALYSTLVLNALYKTQIVALTVTAGQFGYFFNDPSRLYAFRQFNSAGTKTQYFTSTLTNGYEGITGYGGESSGTFESISSKQVLTPSATGVTLVSTKDGSTFNLLSADASFNWNDSGGYTYKIYDTLSYSLPGEGFDGIDDRIVHPSINFGTSHTLHYWLNYQGIAGIVHGGAANQHSMNLSASNLGYNAGTTEVTVAHGLSVGDKALLSVVRNASTVKFYKNGAQLETDKTLLANNNLVLTDIGRYSDGTSYFGGEIYEAMGFNRACQDSEILNFFNASRHRQGV